MGNATSLQNASPFELQRTLLGQLANLGASGQAENEEDDLFAKRLLPITEHLRAFDPAVALVIGDRGTGKSELFRAVFAKGLLPDLARYGPDLRLPYGQPERLHWVQGYPRGKDFADQRGQQKLLKPANFVKLGMDFWEAYLLRALRKQLDQKAKSALESVFAPPGASPGEVIAAFSDVEEKATLALDRLDERLVQEDEWMFVGYDELDTFGGYDWDTMVKGVNGLIAFWAGYSRRWERIRPKLFLRTDLFRRHVRSGGADLPKMAANRVELVWSDANLLAMLVKRAANSGDVLCDYCRKAGIPFRPERDSKLGHLPAFKTADEARPLIERMVGLYMGKNANKGRSFNWVLDHLRDGKGKVAPRSLVRLFEIAALKEEEKPRAEYPRLLHPTSLRQAMEDVSRFHVTQAIQNEWPWLEGVKARLAGAGPAPWASDDRIIILLEKNWRKQWGPPDNKDIRPPANTAEELIDFLLNLGLLRERSDGRLDVPDIYLFGMGLRRKGGVSSR